MNDWEWLQLYSKQATFQNVVTLVGTLAASISAIADSFLTRQPKVVPLQEKDRRSKQRAKQLDSNSKLS